MAVQQGYGKMAGTDALVFAYDTGDAVNSYKGEPVRNDFNFDLFTPSGYGGDGTLQPDALDPFGTTNNPVYRKTGKLRFGPTNGTDVGTLYYGKTYTFSIYLRFVPGQPTFTGGEFDLYDRSDSRNFSGGLGDNMTYEWKRFSVTAFHNNNSNYHFVDIGHYQGEGVFEWTCPQIEENTHMTPFTPHESPRSATEGLLDLTGTTSIDLSNMSFDSDAYLDLDGSSDYVDLGADLQVSLINQGWTAEYIVKTDSASTLQHFNGCDEDVHNAGWIALYNSKLAVWNRDPGGWYYGDTVFTSNTWYHVTFVQVNGTTMQFYVNGVAEGGSHTTYSWNASKSAFFARYIGRYSYSGYSRYWNGTIPVTKFYNRALSAAEVQANFNNYKTRFNIA